jgi:hypothetical protein
MKESNYDIRVVEGKNKAWSPCDLQGASVEDILAALKDIFEGAYEEGRRAGFESGLDQARGCCKECEDFEEIEDDYNIDEVMGR